MDGHRGTDEKPWLEEIYEHMFRGFGSDHVLPFSLPPTIVMRYSRPAALFFTDSSFILRKREDMAALSTAEILATMTAASDQPGDVIAVHVRCMNRQQALKKHVSTRPATAGAQRTQKGVNTSTKELDVTYLRETDLIDLLTGRRGNRSGIIQAFDTSSAAADGSGFVSMIRHDWSRWQSSSELRRAHRPLKDRSATLHSRLSTWGSIPLSGIDVSSSALGKRSDQGAELISNAVNSTLVKPNQLWTMASFWKVDHSQGMLSFCWVGSVRTSARTQRGLQTQVAQLDCLKATTFSSNATCPLCRAHISPPDNVSAEHALHGIPTRQLVRALKRPAIAGRIPSSQEWVPLHTVAPAQRRATEDSLLNAVQTQNAATITLLSAGFQGKLESTFLDGQQFERILKKDSQLWSRQFRLCEDCILHVMNSEQEAGDRLVRSMRTPTEELLAQKSPSRAAYAGHNIRAGSQPATSLHTTTKENSNSNSNSPMRPKTASHIPTRPSMAALSIQNFSSACAPNTGVAYNAKHQKYRPRTASTRPSGTTHSLHDSDRFAHRGAPMVSTDHSRNMMRSQSSWLFASADNNSNTHALQRSPKKTPSPDCQPPKIAAFAGQSLRSRIREGKSHHEFSSTLHRARSDQLNASEANRMVPPDDGHFESYETYMMARRLQQTIPELIGKGNGHADSEWLRPSAKPKQSRNCNKSKQRHGNTVGEAMDKGAILSVTHEKLPSYLLSHKDEEPADLAAPVRNVTNAFTVFSMLDGL